MDLENLQIKIEADVKNATSSIDSLIGKLNKLNSALGGLDGDKLNKFSDGMEKLTKALEGMKSINASVFTKTAKGLKQFDSIDGTKLNALATAMQPLATGITSLGSAQFDARNMATFITALRDLSNANLQSLNAVSFDVLGQSITKLSNSLSGAKVVSTNTIALTNALANLGQGGQYINEVNTTLPNLSQSLKKFMVTMRGVGDVSDNTIQFTNAIAKLASAGARTSATANNLNKLRLELDKFFQTMANAPQVSANTLALVQSLAQLTNASRGFGGASSALNRGFSNFNLGARNSAKSAKSLASAFGHFYARFWLVIRAFKGIGKAIDIKSDLVEVQNVVDVAFKQYADKVETFSKNTVKKYGITELTSKTIASRFQAMGNAIGIANSKVEQSSKFLNGKVADGYDGMATSMADVSINLTKLAADMGSFYNVEATEVAESLQSIFTGTTKPLRSYGLDLTQATLQEWALKNGLDADVKSMTQAEKVLLRYNYVMANTTDAQNDFQRTSMSWANQTRILKQQLQQLAIIIGEVFINALKPALRAFNSFVEQIIKGARVVADALGQIFGWTIDDSFSEGAKNLTDDIMGLGDDAEDTSDSLAKLNKQLAGFDKLNNLTTNDKNKGKGSGLGADLSAFAGNESAFKKTDGLIEKYQSSIKTLEQLGEKINQTLTDNLANIDWNKIYRKAENFGTGLADFLNGLISPDLFGEVGKTIANSLNTMLTSALAFGKTFDFSEFGLSIANGINGFFQNFKFGDFARTINTWVHGIEDTLVSALTNIDFKSVVLGFFDFLNNLDLDVITLAIGGFLWKYKGKEIVAGALHNLLSKKIAIGIGSGSIPLSTTLGLSVATAIVGFKIGNMLYDHVPKIKEWADALVDWMFDGGDKINIGKTITVGIGALTVSIGSALLVGAVQKALTGALAGKSMNLLFNATVATGTANGAAQSLLGGMKAWLTSSAASAGLASIGAAIVAGLELGKASSSYINKEIIAPVLEALGKSELAEYYEEYNGITGTIELIEMFPQEVETLAEQTREKVNKNGGFFGNLKKAWEDSAVHDVAKDIQNTFFPKVTTKSIFSRTQEEYEKFQDVLNGKGKNGGGGGHSFNGKKKEQEVLSLEEMTEALGKFKKVLNLENIEESTSKTVSAIGKTLGKMGSVVKKSLEDTNIIVKNNSWEQYGTDTVTGYVKGITNKWVNGSASYDTGLKWAIKHSANIVKGSSWETEGTSVVSSYVKGITDKWINGSNSYDKGLAWALKHSTDMVKKESWKEPGENLVQGLNTGVTKEWGKKTKGSLISNIVDMASDMTAKLKKAFGIHSPSRLWQDQIGVMLPRGLAKGVEKDSNVVYDAIDTLGKGMTKEMEGAFTVNPSTSLKGVASNFKAEMSSDISAKATFSATDTIKQAVHEGMAEAFSQGGIKADVNLKVESDSNNLFKVVKNEAQDYYNRTGKPAFN